MKTKLFIFCSILALIACQAKPTKTNLQLGGPEQGFAPPPMWNSSMQALQKEMFMLEPYIFDSKKFSDPQNKEFLSKEIHNLADDAKNVKHDPLVILKDPTVRFVATQFAEELQKADENFKAGWNEYSRSQLANVTSFCLECHTRLREGPAFNPHDSVRPYIHTLAVADQIEFMIAFRQFEPALKLALENLKQIQTDQKLSFETDRVARLAMLLTVQYLNDPDKTKEVIRLIENNPSMPTYLKQANKLWKKSVAQWNPNDTFEVLPKIRNLLNKRISEVEDMRAIPALLKLLTEGLSRDELGEALLLTGESYESLHKISILSLHDHYYEACVRQAPHTKWAKICFAKLSESVTLSYTGSSGTRIPKDIKNRLDELKNVVEPTQQKK